MPSNQIQWFPGHMAKTRRLIRENLSDVDIVIEVLDARIPYSSKNPEITGLAGDKPMLTVFSKASLADPSVTDLWKKKYQSENRVCLFTDCITGEGYRELPEAIRAAMHEKLERYRQKGMNGRALRAMIVGIPNVGKSSLINRLAGGKRARVEDRPGVTTAKQWVPTRIGLELMDMPGVLWPKFEERAVGENLAVTGAIRDAVLDGEEIATLLCARLRWLYPALFAARYKLDDEQKLESAPAWELFEWVGRKRGFLISGGEINTERTSVMLLDEFRSGKIGRISLERPNQPIAPPDENTEDAPC